MKLRFRITASVLALLLFIGCQKESDDTPADSNQPREWYQLVNIDTLSSETMIKEFSGYNVLLSVGPDMVRATFLYHSMSDTTTLTLSGCTCWPVDVKSCSSIWFENHYTSTKWTQCPSQSIEPGMILGSSRNAIFIGADYQGLGYTRDLPHPYLNTILLGRQSADCFKAALQVIRDLGPELSDSYSTYNFGYSLGGGITLAVARLVESEPELKQIMHLEKSYCGGGPYDQAAMMRQFMSKPDQDMEYPISFPLAIKSTFYSSPSFRARYSQEDFFSPALLESGLLRLIDDKEVASYTINDILVDAGFKTVRSLLREEVIPIDSPEMTDLFNELSKMDLTEGWVPTTPILFYHARYDNIVPMVCVERIQANMPDNPNITYRIKDSQLHDDEGINFYLGLLLGLL